jgi:hypothetical protein
VQQPALFEAQMSHVLVVFMQDRKARQDRIAVVAVVIDHVATVGVVAPDVFGEEFVLGLRRPVRVLFGVPDVQTLDFLEEDDVGRQFAQAVAQLVHHHAAIELGKALVDVPGGDGEGAVSCRGQRCAFPVGVADEMRKAAVCCGRFRRLHAVYPE